MFVSVGLVNGQTGTWKEFSSADGGFKVLLPGTPTDVTTPNSPSDGMRVNEYELRSDYVGYKLGFSKAPISPKADDAVVMKDFWDKYVVDMEKNEGVKVLSQGDFQVGGVLGREVTMDNGELILVNRYIVKNYYFYILITMTYKENHKVPSVERARREYLDSFAFLTSTPK
ncbi:MAG: hypothetical protein ABI999_14630 [Acidobacteriota bacterium]